MVVDAFRMSGEKPGRWGTKSVVVDFWVGKGEGTVSLARSVSM